MTLNIVEFIRKEQRSLPIAKVFFDTVYVGSGPGRLGLHVVFEGSDTVYFHDYVDDFARTIFERGGLLEKLKGKTLDDLFELFYAERDKHPDLQP